MKLPIAAELQDINLGRNKPRRCCS